MMNLIEKYVYTVTHFLPKGARPDVERELHANITDMLPENYTDADTEKVLRKLGNPAVLAEQYKEGKNSLIGPAVYGQYVYVLKLVAIIVGCIIPFAAVIITIVDNELVYIGEMLLNVLVQTVTMGAIAAYQVFTWVTIVFAVLDRTGVFEKMKWPYSGQEWNVSDLLEPTIPQKGEIPKREPVLSIVFGVVFAALLAFFPMVFAMRVITEYGAEVTPFFNTDVLANYVPFILITVFVGILVSVLMLIYKRWNMVLCIGNALHNVIVIVLAAALLFNPALINPEFIPAFAEVINAEMPDFETTVQMIAGLAMTGIAVICIWDAINGFRRL